MQRLTVLGATGSIGRSTLDVVARHPQRIAIHALTARQDVEGLFELCQRHRPEIAVLAEPAAAAELRRRCAEARLPVRVEGGAEAIAAVAAAPESEQVMSAIVGAAGLLPTLAAVRAGKRVLIANKEPLVMAGALLLDAARASGATLIPIDSEHNAIFQCLPAGSRCGTAVAGVERLVLTASGGPFRELPLAQLATVSPAQAVRHPNWSMGPKISVDSATMMNKGLELIEAHHLFAIAPDRIDVVLHPESIVHSLVAYRDGSMLAQLGQPDMRVPIAHALAHPQRWESGVEALDLSALARLRFAPVEPARYPCLGLARDALSRGGIYPNVLNAANEVAVEAFLGERIAYGRIPAVIESALDAAAGAHLPGANSLDDILAVDAWARAAARSALVQPARARAGAGA